MPTVEERVEAAAELGDRVNGHPERVDQVLPRLIAMLRDESDPVVIAEVVTALGHAWDERACAVLLELSSRDRPDVRVRRALARALPGGVETDRTREGVTAALIRFTRDPDEDVRNWACFGLGQLDADTAAAREALADRLDDPHDETRCEALNALAQAGDARAVAVLCERLIGDPDSLCLLEVQAAAEAASPVLHPLLMRLAQAWDGDADQFTAPLAHALRRCHPEAAAKAAETEDKLVAILNELLAGQDLIAQLDGAYPRSELSLVARDGAPRLQDRLWPGEDPWNYPLEQQVQTYRQSALDEAHQEPS